MALRIGSMTRGIIQPSVFSAEPIMAWGTGAGLKAFAGGSARETALNWRRVLLQGDPGSVPLIAQSTPYASTFVCESRMQVLQELAPRLTALDEGSLCGPRNCFAAIGPRQIGKSVYLRSLLVTIARAASEKTVAIGVNLALDGVTEPLHLLQRALQLPQSGVALPAALAEPTCSIADILAFMSAQGVRAVIGIDGVEELFRCAREDPVAGRVMRQLKALGSCDGPRSVIVILTGSSALLRCLLYATDTVGHEYVARLFPLHLRYGSMDENAFRPLQLLPVLASSDLAAATLSIASSLSAEELASLVERECIVEPETQGLDRAATSPASCADTSHTVASCAEAVLPVTSTASVSAGSSAVITPQPVCCIAAGYEVDPSYEEWLGSRCRGLAGWIAEALRNTMSKTYYLDHLLGPLSDAGPASRRVLLGRLLSAWERSMGKRDVVVIAAGMDASICAFGMPLESGEPLAPWYDLADRGVLRVDDTTLPLRVHFMHPSDAGTLILTLRR